MSSPTDPVGMTDISGISPPPSDMIAPLPNCFSMALTAAETIFNFSFKVDMSTLLLVGKASGWLRAACHREEPALPGQRPRPVRESPRRWPVHGSGGRKSCRMALAAPSIRRPVEQAVLQGLADVAGGDAVGPLGVGDGASDAPDPVDGPRGERQTLDRPCEEVVAARIQAGHGGQLGGGEPGVGAGTPTALAPARLLDPGPHQGARLAGAATGELLVGNGRDLDVHDDPVEQRPGQLGPVPGDGPA